ncbi:tetratricopeptide repeat protein [Patescibacteria group bacterium]|nr:tetratricopeptide repeat protein [Patescibacteria group bacterium]
MNIKAKDKQSLIIFIIFIAVVIFNKWQIFTSHSYLKLGDDNISGGNTVDSLHDYKYAAVIDGNREVVYQARIKRAEIFLKYNQLDSVQNEINIALKENKFDYRAYEIMGDVYYKKRDILSALKSYREAIDLENNEEINIKMVKTLIANNENEQAQELLLELLSENSDNIEIIYYLGLLEYYINADFNDYFKTIEIIENNQYKNRIAVIKDHYRDDEIIKLKKLSDILVISSFNEIDEPYFAINKSREVLKINPNYRDAWIQLGKSYFILEDYQSASDSFSSALELDSNNPEILFWLFKVFEKMGNVLQADEYLEKYNQY